MPPDQARRAVITGVGALTPIGNDAATFWSNLVAGVSGVDRITAYDPSNEEVQIAAEVKGFDPRTYIDFKAARRMSRFSQLAVAAAAQAIEDSGLQITDANRDDIAVVVNTGGGGIGDVASAEDVYREQGPTRVSPFMVPMLSPSMAACQISIQNKLRGPVVTSVAACASGVQAFIEAQRMIEHHDADVVITGGTESAILPVAFAALANMGALSKRNDDPEGASRPFDAERDGFVMGEAGAMIVLEDLEHARARGAKIYAELLGYGVSSDATHVSDPDPTGQSPARALEMAIADAAISPDEVGYINAHGTSTPVGDSAETRVIKLALGEEKAYRTPVSSTKGATGHCLGAAGAVEASFTILALERGVLPPTINQEVPDPECDLDYIPNESREQQVEIGVSNSFGFGGHNACVVFQRWHG
jgi:3-oxoacyl-[acyl-carrier-protein] synthase II